MPHEDGTDLLPLTPLATGKQGEGMGNGNTVGNRRSGCRGWK